MDAPADLPSLDDIRREIDAIDDALLALVARRLGVIEQVRLAKSRSGDMAHSPIRPAREAYILRRLIKAAEGRVPPALCVRLWRALIATATLQQARVGIHMTGELFADAGARPLIAEHFGAADLVSHAGIASALAALGGREGDIAIVAREALWPQAVAQGHAGKAQVICCLPFLAEAAMPRLLVFGHTPPEPTGDDETLIITSRRIAAPPLWQAEIAGSHVMSLPGFLAGDDPALTGAPGLKIAGRYPRPLAARR